jgi:outer membrane protein OmpA-like peptidoglycan-associated protein
MDAKAVTEGVSISLNDIKFVPDKAQMLPGESEKLKKIIEILKKYPGRDLLVIGQTARVPNKGDGKILSAERAAAVAGQIIESGARTSEQIVVKGVGNSEPAGDDSTEEGRKKNRRVQIIILEN